MGCKVLVAAICWLALCEALEVAKKVNSSTVKDNASAESAYQLYPKITNVFGVYASAAPYGAYSFNTPNVIRAPAAFASQVGPVTFAGNAGKDNNAYMKSLKDSYGKFLASPQAFAFKTAFPQQYLPIQALPAHLTQPLAATAAPNSQFKQFTPNFVLKGPSLFSASPTPLTQLRGLAQPLVYAKNVQNLMPGSSFFSQFPGFVIGQQQQQQQQATGSQSAANSQQHRSLFHQPIQHHHSQQSSASGIHQQSASGTHQQSALGHKDNGQILAAPAQTSVTAIVNGKKSIITLDTKPPIPQVDLSLLEPLTFDNPIVPQVQHFLPKINSVTYEKLPTFNVQRPKQSNDDSKPRNTSNKKTPKKPQNVLVNQPRVVVKGNPDGEQKTYHIDTPNHKETYNEEVVSYKKETNSEPISYSYNKQTQNEPESYSYNHNSKQPLKVTHVEYGSNERPKELIYTLNPEEHEEENNEGNQQDTSGEINDENSRDEHAQKLPDNQHYENNDEYSQRHKNYKNTKDTQNQYIHFGTPAYMNYQNSPVFYVSHMPQNNGYQSNQQHPSKSYHHSHHHGQHTELPNHHHHHHAPNTERTQTPTHSTEPPKHNHNLKVEHRGQKSQHEITATPQYYYQPVVVQNAYPLITHNYEENIKIIPTHNPNTLSRKANIMVDPTQHVQLGPSTQYYDGSTSPAPQQDYKEQKATSSPPSPSSRPFSSAAPHIVEHSTQVENNENDEGPDDVRTRMEQVMTAIMGQEEDEEANFEKAYKESAFGFPAYDASKEESDDGDIDIYNPDSYGAPRYQVSYNAEDNPFEKYQAEGDQFPKALRSSYKDARDENKQDYYLDFSVNKPDIYADFYKKKADYIKSYKKHKPEISFGDENEKNKKKHNGDETRKEVTSSSFLYPVRPSQKIKENKFLGQYRAPKITLEYDYSKGAPRGSNAFASQPFSNKIYRTNFVNPQLQYGFEPITAPLVLDSELAAMASNNSPESEKPGLRKKVYKENWYIKKTSTTAGEPS